MIFTSRLSLLSCHRVEEVHISSTTHYMIHLVAVPMISVISHGLRGSCLCFFNPGPRGTPALHVFWSLPSQSKMPDSNERVFIGLQQSLMTS